MVLNSLKFRVIISVAGIVAISLAVMIFFFARNAKHELARSLDENALDLPFPRKSDPSVSSHDISELIDKTLELAATDYDLKKQYDFKTIEIVREYGGKIPLLHCEGGEIQQVLLNIFKNGAQAMQEVPEKASRFIIRTGYDKRKNRVVVEIEDNGPGMDEGIRKRIFEPFYTTKSEGNGTGLGLSVSYFIITENHDGEMTVESQPGVMTRFIIKIPVENCKVSKRDS